MNHSICPRCNHANESRARFCANCGLNLVAAARGVSAHTLRAPSRHSGNWLVLTVLSFLILLAGLAAAFFGSARLQIQPIGRTLNSSRVSSQDEGEEVIQGRYELPPVPKHARHRWNDN